ncbi:MAG: DUF3037 domain-containing protein [Caldilineaceae bacterium]|nr:DUF3037 domain-containing protein [Caldilineaceae bacterium]
MPGLHSYDYAFIRVVPYIDRGEFVNVGVILFCRTLRYLDAQIWIDEAKVAALAPPFDMEQLQTHLDFIPRICAGDGPIGQLGQAESFHWLVSPHNTVIQTSPVHSGLCKDPVVALAHLMKTLG